MRMDINFSNSEIKRKILEDKYNSIIFKTKKDPEVYIVGGYIRDTLLGRKSLDRDYVAKGNFQRILKEIADRANRKIIRIGKKGLFRIVLENGQMFDFMPFNKDIENDLSLRDFTINSLAWSPESGIIDVKNGIKDLSKKCIRMTNKKNLIDDPVRIIRAYRLADELSFSIEPETRKSLKEFGGLLEYAKSERITLEFYRIINSKNSLKTLKLLFKDGILNQIISLSFNRIVENHKAIYKLNKIFNKLPLKYIFKIDSNFSQNLLYRGLLVLEILLSGMPDNRLNKSSKINKHLEKLERANNLYIKNQKKINKELLYEIFKLSGEASFDFLILNNLIRFLPDLEKYNMMRKKGVLTSEEIIKITKKNQGRDLGIIIDYIKKAQFTDKVRCKREAIEFLKGIDIK